MGERLENLRGAPRANALEQGSRDAVYFREGYTPKQVYVDQLSNRLDLLHSKLSISAIKIILETGKIPTLSFMSMTGDLLLQLLISRILVSGPDRREVCRY